MSSDREGQGAGSCQSGDILCRQEWAVRHSLKNWDLRHPAENPENPHTAVNPRGARHRFVKDWIAHG